MNDDNQPATKKDVENAIKQITPGIVTEIVTNVVNSVVEKSTKQILDAVGEQFNTVIDQIDELSDDVSFIKNRLNSTVDKVSDHEIRIKNLEPKTA